MGREGDDMCKTEGRGRLAPKIEIIRDTRELERYREQPSRSFSAYRLDPKRFVTFQLVNKTDSV